MDRGYVCLWRKLRDSEIVRHPELLQVFIALLLESEDSPVKKITYTKDIITINPGEVLISYDKLSNRLNIAEQSLITFIEVLEQIDVIKHEPIVILEAEELDGVSPWCMEAIIKIYNWNIYQPPVLEDEYLKAVDKEVDVITTVETGEARDDQ